MTTFIHLKEIIDKKWANGFEPLFRQPETVGKRPLMEELTAVNAVRNSLMHPVRAFALGEGHFDQVRSLAGQVSTARTCLITP